MLATLHADGAPLATPMWFLHDATHVTMLSVEATQKVRNLRRDPRVSMAVETSGPSGSGGRGVIVQGGAESLADGPERQALVERFHAR